MTIRNRLLIHPRTSTVAILAVIMLLENSAIKSAVAGVWSHADDGECSCDAL